MIGAPRLLGVPWLELVLQAPDLGASLLVLWSLGIGVVLAKLALAVTALHRGRGIAASATALDGGPSGGLVRSP